MSESERTVLFIDLVDFTVATVTHGDHTAADLAERLVELTTSSLGSTDQLVKGLGDAVMIVCHKPHNALALAGRICDRADHESAFPLLRMGLHHGPVVERHDDWFGTTVNIAARLAALAGPGDVLTTDTVVTAAAGAGMKVEQLGAQRLRGITEPVEVFSVTPCPAEPNRVIDPNCRMAVERTLAAATRTQGGNEYHFCSVTCVNTFDRTYGGQATHPLAAPETGEPDENEQHREGPDEQPGEGSHPEKVRGSTPETSRWDRRR